MPRKKRRTFTKQQKDEAVRIWRQSGKSIAEVARDLDLVENSLRKWVKQAEIDDEGPTESGPLTSIAEWIEVFYNGQRRHSTIGYCSPVEYGRTTRRPPRVRPHKTRCPIFWGKTKPLSTTVVTIPQLCQTALGEPPDGTAQRAPPPYATGYHW